MSVDHKITQINEAIYNVFTVLYRMNAELDETLQNMNVSLEDVDNKIKNVVVHSHSVESDIVSIAKQFPGHITYYIILFIVIILLNMLSLFLVYHIYKSIREIEFRSDKIIRKFNKKQYTSLHDDRNRFLVEDAETPPPTYDEYVKTADLYVKYHRNASHQYVTSTVEEQIEI